MITSLKCAKKLLLIYGGVIGVLQCRFEVNAQAALGVALLQRHSNQSYQSCSPLQCIIETRSNRRLE